MNTTRKINVNFSSLVGLKAELLRKQTEVNEIKLKSEISHTTCKTKRKSKRTEEKSAKKDSENIDINYVSDIDAHKKSKLMLEAKAKLYDRLKRSKNSSDNFLVDFTNKSDESEEELLSKDNEQENDVALKDDDDDWVEYEDCFGRTRKCLREDLQHMKKKDELMKQQIISKKGIDPKTNNNVEQNVTEETKETEIEIMRKKWEDQSNKLMDKVNIHYQDILFDEARAHGVGYYAFSQDEEERIKQQENLINLRKETEQKQKEIKEVRELRENMEKNRLKAARIRQRIRAGLPVDSIKEDVEQKSNNEFKVNPLYQNTNEQSIENAEDNSNMQCKQENAELEKQNKIKALGELLNKKNYWYEMSQEEWVDKCRKSRISEFGPMYNNYKNIDNAQLECSDVSLVLENTTTCNTNVMDIQSNVESNATQSNLNSYNAPAQPISTSNNMHKTVDLSSQVNLETSYTVQHDSNNEDAVNDIARSEIKPKRSMDETSIEAGLRYLRRKFEENQNT